MRQPLRSTSLLALALALAGALGAHGLRPAQADDPAKKTVSGKVLDADGKPLEGAEVAGVWISEGEQARARDGVKTDAEGKFTLTVRRLPAPLMAVAADGKRGGIAVAREGTSDEVEIAVEPLVLVEARLVFEDRSVTFGGGLAVLAVDDDLQFAGCRTKTGTVTFRVPAGEYTLVAQAEDAKPLVKKVSVPKGEKADLGPMTLEPTELAKSYGKAAPAVTAIERGGATTGLESLKGKWVLLEFWGFW